MDNSKIENILNLALNSTMEEREKSQNLNVGYDQAERTWEVIVKYNGNIKRLESEVIQVEELLAGYAIITLPESLLSALAQLSEIEYIEKPKRLFFSLMQGKEASCIRQVTIGREGLSGRGVLIAVIDSGIDYTNMDFRTRNGESRILYLWDQALGVEYTKAQIDEALAAPTQAAAAAKRGCFRPRYGSSRNRGRERKCFGRKVYGSGAGKRIARSKVRNASGGRISPHNGADAGGGLCDP